MQNLTAHYNILFNAKEILRQKQEASATAFVDNYNEVLNVYPDTTAQSTTPDKDLEEAILKGNKIINIKEQSKYLGDAYLVIGKANFLEGNYFNANEFFNYVLRSFGQRTDLVQDASAWKARSLIYLNQLPQAKLILDTALINIDIKKNTAADVYAAKLQYDINTQDYPEAEDMAKKAIQYSNTKQLELRWKFILAQLQELNHKGTDAVINYTQIIKSNSTFEMAFNASLNRIRIEDAREGIKTTRTQRLLALMKDPNNKEFKDQVYFQIAQLQMIDKNVDGAIKNYKLSVRNSLRNQNQKGLSYLKLAEIYFNNKADYLTAKKYYDSTLTSLPVNYPGYQQLKKKAANLQLLSDRLQTISREDTLQALAKMDETTRNTIIDKMVSDNILQQQAADNASTAAADAIANDGPQSGSNGSTSNTFYFYNTTALSQGYADFKKKWGNRKLEDNWRRSNRANSDITNNSVNNQSVDPDAPVGQLPSGKVSVSAGSYRKELLQGLPLTPAQLTQSNLRVYNAYLDIGNFYRDVLQDKKEAIRYFELLLQRFPNDPGKPAVYYNLYRLYTDLDNVKADKYKDLLLKNYPDTPFAKVIADPDYARKLNEGNTEFTTAYNKVFDLYTHKQYSDVITGVPALLKQYPGNKYSAQLYYLKTIAEGHQEKVGPFADSLRAIVKQYPDDKLITPLINQHLTYINTNEPELLARDVILIDDNPQDLPFTLTTALKEETAYRPAVREVNFAANDARKAAAEKAKEAAAKPAAQIKPAEKTIAAPPVTTQLLPNQPKPIEAKKDTPLVASATPATVDIDSAPVQQTAKIPDVASIFSMSDSTNYLFIVNVSSGTTNLASSRFGIGQFNRVNYTGQGIRHLVKLVGADNQLIYVGRFYSLNDVKKYARQIVPLLPDIMKVPKDKYSFFIITQENLNKFADKNTLDSYVDYYQKNY